MPGAGSRREATSDQTAGKLSAHGGRNVTNPSLRFPNLALRLRPMRHILLPVGAAGTRQLVGPTRDTQLDLEKILMERAVRGEAGGVGGIHGG